MIKILKKINKFFLSKKEKKNIFYFLLFSLIIPFLELISIASLSALILFFLDFELYLKSFPIQSIKTFLINENKIFLLKLLSSFVFGAVLFKNFILFLYFYFEKKISKNLILENTNKLFKNHLSLPYIYHKNLNTSDVQNNILYQAKKISSYIFYVIGLIKDLLISLFFLASLLFLNFKATLLLLLFSFLVGLLFYYFTSKKIRALGDSVRNLQSQLIEVVQVATEGIKSIIIFLKKKQFQEKFSISLSEKETKEMEYFLISKIPRLAIEVIFMFLLIMLMFILVNKTSALGSVLPFFITLSLISIRLIPVISNISLIFTNLNYLEPSLLNIFNNAQTSEKNILRAEHEKENYNFNINSINLKNISYRYEDGDKKILKKININLKTNNIYCIVGSTGSGKSTLLDIILGLIDPSSGEIIVNNKLKMSSNNYNWYKKISYVPQDTFIFYDTLEKNISFSDLKNKKDKNKMDLVIKLSCLKKFNDNLNKKKNSKIGSRGTNISGGQKQRIGIARALFKNNEVLVMDEATSALDELTETKLFQNIKKIKKNKIILMVSHRLTTINKCDQIIYLHKGTIKFVGDPKNFYL